MTGPKTKSKLNLEKKYSLKKKSINNSSWKKTNEKIMVNKNPIRMFFSPIEAMFRSNVEHTKNLVNYYSGKKKQTKRAEDRKLQRDKKML